MADLGPLFSGPPLGIGMLTAGIVLAIMVIPFIASVMRDVFLTVPGQLKESSYALGSTTWEVVWDIVLPYTRSAVIGGIFLGLGRAWGRPWP
jgi:phosphate transport system permease protein